MIWVGVALCVLVSFIFSGIEAGILSVNRVRLKHRLKLGDRAARKLDRLLKQPERLLVTVLVVTNLMNITAVVLTTEELVRWLGGRGYFVAGALALPIYLLGLELLPKSLFRRFPYRALAALAEPLRLADLLLAPMHFVGWRLSRIFFKERPADQQKLFVAREDFKYLTIESERTGTLGKAEREMIHNVIDFRHVAARDVMVPMSEVRTIAAEAPVAEILAKHAETGFERWPVRGADGAITGLVDIFEIALRGRREATAGQLQRRIVSIAAESPAYAVLRRLRAARASLAVALDGEGKPAGIVSAEDLVKRLVSMAAAGK